jgi:CheY-like chemotaxis protein/HPt (histidine-containing phosphotransfer) domain-containing protein
VLIVDDNAANRRILRETLRRWQVATQSVRNGVSALAAIRNAKRQGAMFDLIILDVHMPGMSGFETERELRKMSLSPPPRVMFLSSLGQDNECADREVVGRNTYLTKPVRQTQLLDTILKILEHQPTDAAMPGTCSSSAEVAGPSPLQARILLVEDNPVNRKVAIGMLAKCNHHVSIAENGREALEALEQSSFDMVFMDVQMPVMDGLEATRQIRADKRWRDLPVIAMTAHAMKGDRERCLKAGMDDYLCKPIEAKELEQMVNKWGDNRVQRAEPASLPDTKRTPTGSSQSPLDLEAALLQLENDRELFDEVFTAFMDNLPVVMDQLRSAVTSGDARQLFTAAHTLKGGAAVVAAEPIRVIAARLEELGQTGEMETAVAAIRELEAEILQLQEAAPLINHQVQSNHEPTL